MQTLVVLCLGSLAQIGMTVATAGWAVGLLAVASLASATQDIANDGMAAEHFSGDTLAKINAIQIAGVMIGFFGGGAGTLTLIGLFGQRAAFLALAAVPLASLACVLWCCRAMRIVHVRKPNPTRASCASRSGRALGRCCRSRCCRR